jgi:DNA (cytosine-5)-methyltransferase 1
MSALTAIDLFAGAGGATLGLRDAGFDVIGAVENDVDAAATYALSHEETRLWTADIRRIAATAMRRELGLETRQLALLKACPPCQGFSSLAEGRARVNAAQNDLVLDTIRFVRAFLPRAVMIENVPGLGRDERSTMLLTKLAELGYACRQYAVDAAQFGVPQRRKRLIILGFLGRRRQLPDALPAVGLDDPTPADSAFDQVARALAEKPDDPHDIGRTLSEAVQRRVDAVPIGGNRFDLPLEHQLECHKRLDIRNATASYGRIKLGEPAPTMTTRCTTVACGSFIHPTENRGITLREAAAIQTFPTNYEFSGSYGSIERQIGNAVPVRMASALGRVVSDLLEVGG